MGLKNIYFVLMLVFLAFPCSFFIQYIYDKKTNHKFQNKSVKKRQPVSNSNSFSNPKQNLTIKDYIKKQWALRNINFEKAMQVLKETNKPFPEIHIAVIDSGIHKQHPCLKNSLWHNPGEIPENGKDDDGNGFIDDIHGWNFVENNNNLQDYHGHGTHISGIIAAQGQSAKSPNCLLIGVAPHVKIMTLKYFSENSPSHKNIENTIKSIEYAINNGAHIINYSGGGPGAVEEEKRAIAKAADKGIIFVTATGNEGMKMSHIKQQLKKTKRALAQNKAFSGPESFKHYPAAYNLTNIISLQSQNENNEILNSSNLFEINYLEKKKVQTGPGEDILSTLPPKKYLYSKSTLISKALRKLSLSKEEHNNYGFMTGTSQSTAIATGVTALVKTYYPNWTMEQVIRQVNSTGYGLHETAKIKEKTHQGKKLDAHKALIMRDSSANTFIDKTIPDVTVDIRKLEDENEKSDSHFKDSDHEDQTVNTLKNINKFIHKKNTP